jgi:hypothetical protein
LVLERFNAPDSDRQFDKGAAQKGLESYLKRANPANQYVVFLIRPSGIAMFKDLVAVARTSGFEVGFDAVEEDREIHFTSPPPLDDQTVAPGSGRGTAANSGRMPGAGSTGSGGAYHPGGSAGNSDTGPAGAAGGVIGGTGTNASGGTNTVGEGTNTVGGGTNTIGGGTNSIAGGTNTVGGTNTIGATNTVAGTNMPMNGTNTVPGTPPPPKPKSWWQRLMEWLGL